MKGSLNGGGINLRIISHDYSLNLETKYLLYLKKIQLQLQLSNLEVIKVSVFYYFKYFAL